MAKKTVKCANCGNDNLKTLYDGGDDTFYCSLCCSRTQTATGKDDLITRNYHGRLRVLGAMVGAFWFVIFVVSIWLNITN